MPKEIIQPFEHFDEVDLALNGEVFECPECGGCGEVQIDHPDFDSDEWEECDMCWGQGYLGMIRYNPSPIKKPNS